jgi:His/Glu/Gln/Arg/opine family amino acid ABC transporter permease subunit
VEFDWSIIVLNWPSFVKGALITYYVAFLSMVVALVVGLVLALFRRSSTPILEIPARVYFEFFRSMPLYVFLVWVYYGLRIAFNIGLEAVPTAVLTLGLIAGAYMSEIYRSGLVAVDRGQLEAGRSVGLSQTEVFIWIVFPQMLRIILPATINQFVGVLKGATLAGIIGVFDLMYFARNSTAETFRPFEFYTTAGVIFIATTLVVASFGAFIESRYRWEYV